MRDLEGNEVEVAELKCYDPDDRPAECEYFVGLDLGQMNDFSALVVVRKIQAVDENDYFVMTDSGQHVYNFEVPHIDRFPLGTPYPKIVRDVLALMNRPELQGTKDARRYAAGGGGSTNDPTLCIDATGVGRPCLDMFRMPACETRRRSRSRLVRRNPTRAVGSGRLRSSIL